MEPPVTPAVPTIEIRDNSQRARIAVQLFSVMCVYAVAVVISDYLELRLLQRVVAEDYVSDEDINMNNLRQGLVTLLLIAFYITSAVLFLNWFRRAYGNLRRAGVTYLRFSDSMAVWSWFIPVVSFYRPVQVMNEIWTETQEQVKKYDDTYVMKDGDGLIGIWWALFIIQALVSNFMLRVLFNFNTAPDLVLASRLTVAADLLIIPGLILVIVLIRKVSAFESKLAAEVVKAGGRVVQ